MQNKKNNLGAIIKSAWLNKDYTPNSLRKKCIFPLAISRLLKLRTKKPRDNVFFIKSCAN